MKTALSCRSTQDTDPIFRQLHASLNPSYNHDACVALLYMYLGDTDSREHEHWIHVFDQADIDCME